MALFTRNTLLISLLTILSFSVKGQITASFTADATSGCAPLVVNFTNTSTGPATSYYWDFGNTFTSYFKSASTTYLTPGTYIATLTVYGPGGPDSFKMTITVYPPPIVSFIASATSVCPGTPVTFTSTTIGGTPGPLTYTWNFGDGSVSTATTPIHSYTTSGYFNVTLTATNSMGCLASTTVAKYMYVYTPPLPDFSASDTVLCKAPGTVIFTNKTTGTPGLTYAWDFGDGGTSPLPNPTHTYTLSGSFTVKLTATDGNGCVSSITKTAYISIGGMTASFIPVTTTCVGNVATFVNTSSTHTSSNWDFGDGYSGTGDPGSHLYLTAGTYTVRLIITDGACSDTVTHPISVVTGPAVSFTYSPLDPCPPPASQTFTATAAPGILFSWNFGDGGSGSGSPVVHTYGTDFVYVVLLTADDPVTGCSSSIAHLDTVYNRFWHYLSASPDSGCRPLTVTFLDTNITRVPWDTMFLMHYPFPGVSYSWVFGDGATSTSAYPTATHVYTTAGTYTVTVSFVTTNGCLFTDTLQVLTGNPPVITASAITKRVCYGQPVVFYKKIIKGPVDLYYWALNPATGYYDYDSTTDTVRYHPTPGIYVVTVTASYHGCPGTSIVLDTVVVDSPMAGMYFSVLCYPHNSVQFFDTSWGDDGHTWVFGDGTTSTVKNPLHIYPSVGTYFAYIAAYNSASGCRDTSGATVVLAYPVFDFTATKTLFCEETTDTFNVTATGGYAISYSWVGRKGELFPDTSITGIPYKDTIGHTGRLTITDTFHTAGVYTITLLVQDENLCYDTITKPGYITVAKPAVNFAAIPGTGCWPLTVTFADASADEPGVALSKYMWAFGDGGTSTVTTAKVSHTFTTTGTFTTEEIVTDVAGCTDSATLSLVTVWRAHDDFHANNTFPCIGATANFTDTSSSSVSFFWTFGDGTTSTATSPSHVYTTTGAYTVSLAIVDKHGCTDTIVKAGYMSVTKVTASFTQSDTFSICPPLVVNFTSTGTGATAYSWDFGDGNTSAAPNPSDLYIKPAYYIVTLIDSNSHGCKDTATGHVNVYGYAGSLTYGPLSGCSPLTVHFKALITNVPSIIWDFSDGTVSPSSTSDTINYTYTTAGSFVPKLILSDNTGCQNSSVGIDTIKVDKVYPRFNVIPDPICVNTEVTFKDSSGSYFSTITSWAWTFSNGDVSSVNAPPYVYTVAGTYPVALTVTDGWGCIDSVKKNVIVYPLPVITTSPDTIICLTDAATLTAYGAVSYSWNPATTVSCATCNPVKASPSVVTNYTVTGTDAHSCMNTDTVTVFLKTKTGSHATGDTQICRNAVAQIHDSGGTSYMWIPDAGLLNPAASDPFVSPDFTTKYIAIAYLGSCIPDTQSVWVTVYQIPTVDAGPDQRLVEGSTAQLQATGTLIETYSWDNSTGTLSCDTCSNPVASMSVTTTYFVHVASSFGCKNSDSVTIHIFCDKSQIFMPDAFTPNGDGQNDVFYPRGKGISVISSFRIYNRWGQMLFERSGIQMNDASNAWDGSYEGGKPRPDVYVYVLDAVCETGEPINLKGDVSVIR